MDGYASSAYAHSLAEFGEPIELRTCGGWLLSREVPLGGRDAMGSYPLFCCADWSRVAKDLQELPAELVSVALVADPAADVPPELLHDCFPDICYAYKDHYFADLSRPLSTFVAAHHQRNTKRASQLLTVEHIANPHDYLDTWTGLYGELMKRHAITGIAAFSPSAFAKLMRVPGVLPFVARAGRLIVGMLLWLVSGNVAYYHLAAYTEFGYELKASFALFWHSLETFAAQGIAWAAFGGGAGTQSASSGLARFKQGWATESRPAYFCG